MRSESDRIISGVCGGIATYLGVDSVFIRLAFVLLAFASGLGILIYLILMIIMPKETNYNEISSKVVQDNIEELNSGVKRMGRHPQGPIIAAGLLITIGIYLLFENLGLLTWMGGGVFWSIILIGLGIYLIVRRRN
jgi:phage shock protein PspC (stress-responsive transcriptional regulator)